ncbi:hypothetical protein LTR28_000445, partial [Elasticomyces elasticus]
IIERSPLMSTPPSSPLLLPPRTSRYFHPRNDHRHTMQIAHVCQRRTSPSTNHLPSRRLGSGARSASNRARMRPPSSRPSTQPH